MRFGELFSVGEKRGEGQDAFSLGVAYFLNLALFCLFCVLPIPDTELAVQTRSPVTVYSVQRARWCSRGRSRSGGKENLPITLKQIECGWNNLSDVELMKPNCFPGF